MYIMSNLTQFKNKQNLALLWNIILDELHINTSNKNLMNNINAIFEGNINPFVSRANKNGTLPFRLIVPIIVLELQLIT